MLNFVSMNNNFVNIKTVLVIIILGFLTILFQFFYFDIVLNAFMRGYRKWVLLIELVVLPLVYLGFLVQLVLLIRKAKIIDWNTVKLSLKHLGLFVLLSVVLFIFGMFFQGSL